MTKNYKRSDVLKFENVRILEGVIFSSANTAWSAQVYVPITYDTDRPKKALITVSECTSFEEMKTAILNKYRNILPA